MTARIGSLVAFFSGFVALGYEILWARRLSDIIGATAFASSLVVGVFFLGLAAGAARLGPTAARYASPWRLYGMLELGILAAILPSFFGEQLAGALARGLGPLLLRGAGGALLKAGLALVFVGPPAFLMGGTLPALGQAVVRADRLGREGNLLYGVNTLGGAAGIVVATFLVLPALGVRATFLLFMLGSLGLALVAWRLSGTSATVAVTSRGSGVEERRSLQRAARAGASRSAAATAAAVTPAPISAWEILACISGFTVLGLEILSLHLFGQVLHNSGYTFATVLVVVIAALAVGALVTQNWRLDPTSAWRRLGPILLLGACATAALPRLFVSVTGGMSPFGGGAAGFATYILRILGVGALVIGPVFVLAGWVFPLVLAGAGTLPGRGPAAASPSAGPAHAAIGARWGRLLGVNAAGALLGLLVANHVAMPLAGLWIAMVAWCAVLWVTGLWVGFAGAAAAVGARGRVDAMRSGGHQASVLALGLATLVLLAATRPWTLPVAHLPAGERVVEWRAGPDGIAAVIESAPPVRDMRIKYNNTYSLGGTGNSAQQARMGYLPLLLHPHPRDTAFIGMATGITASAALRDPAAASLTALELSPEITRLACQHFVDANAGVCRSPQARVVVEDGRMFFGATRQSFDAVVADLFVPWQSGTAQLYTREHFEAVRRHLRPGGLFAQWLPLFQLDARGFWGIAATFCAVFPNAWLVIADFQPQYPAVALVGWRDAGGGPELRVLESRCAELGALPALREPMLHEPAGAGMFLVGPVAPALPPGIPILRLDRPWLADHAPRVQRAHPLRYFVGPELVQALERIASRVPDGPLRAPIQLGRQLYAFCDVYDREGHERAAEWLARHVTAPLPAGIFLVPRPERMNWPFTQETGMLLIRRAHREALGSREGGSNTGAERSQRP